MLLLLLTVLLAVAEGCCTLDTFHGHHSITVFTAPGVEGPGKAAGWAARGPIVADAVNQRLAVKDSGFAIVAGLRAFCCFFSRSAVDFPPPRQQRQPDPVRGHCHLRRAKLCGCSVQRPCRLLQSVTAACAGAQVRGCGMTRLWGAGNVSA